MDVSSYNEPSQITRAASPSI